MTANFEQGIRVAQNTFAKEKTRASLGLMGTLPQTTEDWIAIMNKGGIEAPGGGPAYVASSNNQSSGRGDPITGAIGVEWQEAREARTRRNGTVRPARDARLRIWRPLYLGLREQRATITVETIDVINQRASL